MCELSKNDLTDKEALLHALSIKLNFPSYFGHNWDALNDMFHDFSWVKEKEIFLKHEASLGNLKEKDKRDCLEILKKTKEFWLTDDKHNFEFTFPNSN